MNYDNMVARNKSLCRENIEKANRAIGSLISSNEAVTVKALVQKTGLSREFFYKNPDVRRSLSLARQEQMGTVFKRHDKAVLDSAMEETISLLEKQLKKERMEKESLQEEVRKLRSSLRKKDLNLLRSL